VREISDSPFLSSGEASAAAPARDRRPTRRVAMVAFWSLVAVATIGLGAREIAFSLKVRANAWNINDVMTMLRLYKEDNGQYPPSLVELGPYNFKGAGGRRNRLPRPGEDAQDLTKNSFGQPLLYTSDGKSYTLVSPGRHGYQRGRVVPWPEFDGAHNPDTSLVIVDNVAKELALAKGQTKP
jgi:hypothetical protein